MMYAGLVSLALAVSAVPGHSLEERSAVMPTADAVTVDYPVIVTGASGEHAAGIEIGQRAWLSYTLDPSVPNSDPGGDRGVYYGGVRTLTVVLAGQSLAWNTGAGAVFVYNDVNDPPTDQVFFNGFDVDKPLGGDALSHIELSFLKGYDGDPADMIDSVQMPLEPLVSTDTAISFYSMSDITMVNFRIDLMPEFIDQARVQIVFLAGSPNTGRGAARLLNSVVDAIETAWAEDGKTAACAKVDVAERAVRLMVRLRRVQEAEAGDLRAAINAMTAELDCPTH